MSNLEQVLKLLPMLDSKKLDIPYKMRPSQSIQVHIVNMSMAKSCYPHTRFLKISKIHLSYSTLLCKLWPL